MADQTWPELVMNLLNWMESLHEKNLKYEAQLSTLSRDLAQALSSNEQLEARLSNYQGKATNNFKTTNDNNNGLSLIEPQTSSSDSTTSNQILIATSAHHQTSRGDQNQPHLLPHHSATTGTTNQSQLVYHHQQPHQAMGGESTPMAAVATFVPQPAQYVWAYDASGGQPQFHQHEIQVPYHPYEPYGAAAFQQQS